MSSAPCYSSGLQLVLTEESWCSSTASSLHHGAGTQLLAFWWFYSLDQLDLEAFVVAQSCVLTLKRLLQSEVPVSAFSNCKGHRFPQLSASTELCHFTSMLDAYQGCKLPLDNSVSSELESYMSLIAECENYAQKMQTFFTRRLEPKTRSSYYIKWSNAK